MAESDKVWFDPEILWDVASEFHGWHYSLDSESFPAVLPKPTYPAWMFEMAKGEGIGFFDDAQNREIYSRRQPYTNCSMFTEGVIIGSILKAGSTCSWENKHHRWAQVYLRDTDPKEELLRYGVSVRAYVLANMAEQALPGDHPGPGEWCICQVFHKDGGGHSFFIIDSDETKRNGKVVHPCLTLEANVFLNRGRVDNASKGFVGFRLKRDPAQEAWGRHVEDGPPADWREKGPTWEDISAGAKIYFARLHLRSSSKFCAPFDDPRANASPVRMYRNNEDKSKGRSGSYCLANNRSLHGGIHLFPPTRPATAVRSLAPGYIVAVRLPPASPEVPTPDFPAVPAGSPEIFGVVNNWTGFVLVRHEFAVQPAASVGASSGAPASGSGSSGSAPPASAPPPIVLYSLYMHLAPPDHARARNDRYSSGTNPVPWYMGLSKRRYGSWVRVGTGGEPPTGTVYWAREPYDASNGDKEYAVWDVQRKIRPRKDGKVEWIHRTPPLDIGEVFKALAAGKVVTFPEPFLKIGTAGEVIGYCRPLDPDCRRKIPDGASAGFELGALNESGFLHWEIFAPARSNNDIDRLLNLVSTECPNLQSLLNNPALQSSTQHGYLSVTDIRQDVLSRLTAEEKAVLGGGIDNLAAEENKTSKNPLAILRGHKDSLWDMLDGSRSPGPPVEFAKPMAYDGTALGPREAKPTLTYPLTLEIETTWLPPPKQRAGGKKDYELTVEFLGDEGDRPLVTDRFKITDKIFQGEVDDQGTKSIKLALRVPPDAASIRITEKEGALPSFFLVAPDKKAEDSGAKLLEALLPYRWRGVRIIHQNEWSPGGVTAYFQKMKDPNIGLFLQSFNESSMLPLSWWHSNGVELHGRTPDGKATAVMTPDNELCALTPAPANTAAVQRSGSLFGSGTGQLLVDARIDNLHPVTALCLLHILSQKRRLKAISTWEPSSFAEPHRPPVAWGLLAERDGGAPVPGDALHLIVIADDYSYDTTHVIGAQLKLEAIRGQPFAVPVVARDGVAKAETTIDFWGRATLLVDGAGQSPKYTINTTQLEIAAPSLDPLEDQEKRGQLFKPAEIPLDAPLHWSLPVKLKIADGERPVRALSGVVGIELKKKGTDTWYPAKLHQKRVFIPVIARGTPAGDEPIDRSQFVVERDFIVDRMTQARLSTTELMLGRLSFSSLWSVQANNGAVVALSLVVELEALREQFPLGITPSELSRDGRRCLIRAVKPKKPTGRENYALARAAAAKSDSLKVRIPGSDEVLTVSDLPEEPGESDLVTKLDAVGIEVEVLNLETKATLSQNPTSSPLFGKTSKGIKLDPASLLMLDGDQFVRGFDQKKKTGGSITKHFAFDELTRLPRPRISYQLVRALNQLFEKTQSKVLSLDRAGTSCVVEWRKGLVEAARKIPLFVNVADPGKGRPVTLSCAPFGVLFASFDAQPALDALYDPETASGAETIYYRFRFRAVNGLRFVYPKQEGRWPRYVFEDAIAGLNQEPDPSLVFCGTADDDSCGTLRKRAFGQPTVELIERKATVSCPLIGNRTAWAPFEVVVTHLTAPGPAKSPPFVTRVTAGDQVVSASFDIPQSVGELKFTIEARAVIEEIDYQRSEPPTGLNLAVSPKIEDMRIEPFGRKYLIVLCRCTGIEAPSANRPAPDPGEGTSWKESAIKRPLYVDKTMGRTLQLEIQDASGAKVATPIHYLIANVSSTGVVLGGLPNHAGIFCAFVAQSALAEGQRYSFEIKERTVRGATVGNKTSFTR